MVSSYRRHGRLIAAHQLGILLRSLVARVQRLFEELRQLAQRLWLRTPGHDVGMWRLTTLPEQRVDKGSLQREQVSKRDGEESCRGLEHTCRVERGKKSIV